MRRSDYELPVRTVVIYAIFASLWILLSDQALLLLSPNPDQLAVMETVKGWLFVAVSSLLLFVVLRGYMRSRLRAEKDRQMLGAAIEQAAEVVVITGRDGDIQYVNPAFELVTGYSREEVIGRNPRVLKSGRHDEAFYRGLWNTITSGETWKGRITNRRKDGALFTEEVAISPVTNDAGEIVNFVAAKRDITNELRLEAQLQQSQKLESLGTLAAGIAHDFNNILAIILGYSTMVDEQEPAGEDILRRFEAIAQAAKRGAGLVKQLLTFARKSDARLEKVDLNELLADLEGLLSDTFPKNIRISIEPATDLPKATADHAQIHQVLLNLCINARDSMPEGGTLTVRTRAATGEAFENPGMTGDLYAAVDIIDTGCGMDEATRQRVFEPFFTTKVAGKGTGLGLSVVYGIVRNHGGVIELHSAPEKGTAVSVYLPAARP